MRDFGHLTKLEISQCQLQLHKSLQWICTISQNVLQLRQQSKTSEQINLLQLERECEQISCSTFNRDWNRRWSLRSMLILSLTIVASTVTGVKAGDDETLSRSNSWALILLKPAEVQSRRVWVTAAAQSHWISLHYFTRRTDGHRDTLWRI